MKLVAIVSMILLMAPTLDKAPIRGEPGTPIEHASLVEPLPMPELVEEQPVELKETPQPLELPEPVTPTYTPTGNKDSWLQQSGIPQNLWGYVDFLVSRESGWNPCAFYPGQSDCNAMPVNACGLVQQNPCHKIPGDWRDPVAALKWQWQYVNGRYGGYAQAVEYWQVHRHY